MMTSRYPVGEALNMAKRLLSQYPSIKSPDLQFIELLKDFSHIEFDVPNIEDADGCLFQYGIASWLDEPAFVLSFVRQLEILDTSGEHESYSQVQFEFRYDLTQELRQLGSCSKWWFPNVGVPFDAWLDSVMDTPEVGAIIPQIPRSLEVYSDVV
jgi:hypothetical protein